MQGCEYLRITVRSRAWSLGNHIAAHMERFMNVELHQTHFLGWINSGCENTEMCGYTESVKYTNCTGCALLYMYSSIFCSGLCFIFCMLSMFMCAVKVLFLAGVQLQHADTHFTLTHIRAHTHTHTHINSINPGRKRRKQTSFRYWWTPVEYEEGGKKVRRDLGRLWGKSANSRVSISFALCFTYILASFKLLAFYLISPPEEFTRGISFPNPSCECSSSTSNPCLERLQIIWRNTQFDVYYSSFFSNASLHGSMDGNVGPSITSLPTKISDNYWMDSHEIW